MQKNVSLKPRDYFIPVNGEFIPVNKEVYFEYYRPIWVIQKKAQKLGQCVCTMVNLWKCDGDCLVCIYHREGNQVSLDKEYENSEGVTTNLSETISNPAVNIEDFIANADQLDMLKKALDGLDPEGRQICELIMQGQSEREAATAMNMARSTFKRHWAQVRAKLRGIIKDYHL